MNFEEFLAGMKQFFEDQSGPKPPRWNDPSKYPRAIKLSGEAVPEHMRAGVSELQLKLDELHERRRRLESVSDEMSVLWHEAEAVRGRFFLQVRKIFPEVCKDGYGFRMWKGETWIVGYDRQEDQEGEPTEEHPGMYL